MPSWYDVFSISKRPHAGVGDVHEEHPAAAAVLGRREVVGDRAARGGLHVAVATAAAAEPRPSPHALGHRGLGVRDDLVAAVVVQRGVVAQRLEDLLDVVGADHLGPERAVLLLERRDLRQPDLVDLLGDCRGGEEAQRRVDVVAVGQVRQPAPLVGPGLREHLVAQHVAVVLDGRAARFCTTARSRACQRGGVDAGGRVLDVQHLVLVDRRGQQRSSCSTVSPPRIAAGDPTRRPRGAARRARGSSGRARELADQRLGDVGVGHRELRR